MADELKLSITLDTGEVVQGFLNVEKKGEQAAKKVAGAFDGAKESISEFAPELVSQAESFASKAVVLLTNPFVLAGAAIAGVGLALHKAFDLTLEGERIGRIEKQFESLSASAGISGEKLKNEFVKSLDGLVTKSDAIESLNKALVSLGERAAQLPAILDISRKASKVFGRDVTDVFESINQAISSGATRQLKSIGININAEAAYKKYAKSLGLTADVLSEAGKQQAILNEVLAKGDAKFAGISAQSISATSSYKRFKVAVDEVFESIAVSVSKQGSFFSNFFDGLTLLAKRFNNDKDVQMELLQNKINETKVDIFQLQDALEKRKGAGFVDSLLLSLKDGQGVSSAIVSKINNGKEVLASLQKQFDELNKTNISKKETGVDAKSGAGTTSKDEATNLELQKEKLKKIELEYTQFLFSQEQARTNAKIQQNTLALGGEIDAKTKLSIISDTFALQEQLAEDSKNKEIQAIKQKYRELNLSGSIQEANSISAIDDTFKQNRLLQEQQFAQQTKAIQEQANYDSLSGFSAVGAGFSEIADGVKTATTSFVQTSTQAFQAVGKQAFATLSQGVGRAFNNFGAALRNGESAGRAFEQAVSDSLIGIASSFGDTFIQLGIGKLALSYGADATGYTLIAAGAALKILAGFAGGKSAAAPSTDTGGGIAASPSPVTDNQPSQNLTRQEANTQVSVVIQGDVLDSHESGSRIVSLINDAFQNKGIVINQGVMA